jgi:cell wall-associated NlpC family hydrolase
MSARLSLRIPLLALALGLMAVAVARAEDEPPPALQQSQTLLEKASSSIEATLNTALDLLGIRYRWGGSKPESGFDCSGFVGHVFREGLGLDLPRSARELSRTGEPVAKDELQPGDLVFFNTMRRAFSHVGIYLGDNLFVHAPHRGAYVRVDDMSGRYWTKHFNGARRVAEQ